MTSTPACFKSASSRSRSASAEEEAWELSERVMVSRTPSFSKGSSFSTAGGTSGEDRPSVSPAARCNWRTTSRTESVCAPASIPKKQEINANRITSCGVRDTRVLWEAIEGAARRGPVPIRRHITTFEALSESPPVHPRPKRQHLKLRRLIGSAFSLQNFLAEKN